VGIARSQVIVYFLFVCSFVCAFVTQWACHIPFGPNHFKLVPDRLAAWRRVESPTMLPISPCCLGSLATGGGDPLSNHYLAMAATEALDLQGKGKGKRSWSPEMRAKGQQGHGKSSARMRARDAYKGKGAQLSFGAHTAQAPTTEEPTTEKSAEANAPPSDTAPVFVLGAYEHGTSTVSAASPWNCYGVSALIGKGGYEAMEPPFPNFLPPPGLSQPRRTPKLQNARCTVHLQNAEDRAHQNEAAETRVQEINEANKLAALGKGAQLTPPTIDATEAPTTEAPTIDTTEAPTTEAPTVDTTEAPTTEAPTIEAADEEHEDDWLLMTA